MPIKYLAPYCPVEILDTQNTIKKHGHYISDNIRSDIFPNIPPDICSDISFDIFVEILFDNFSDICLDIFSDIFSEGRPAGNIDRKWAVEVRQKILNIIRTRRRRRRKRMKKKEEEEDEEEEKEKVDISIIIKKHKIN